MARRTKKRGKGARGGGGRTAVAAARPGVEAASGESSAGERGSSAAAGERGSGAAAGKLAPASEHESGGAAGDSRSGEAVLRPDEPGAPRFSVLMAAFDRAGLIGGAIESVLRQDFADWELVIVDDGSTDETPAVVARYAAGEPRLRYVRKDRNEGRPAARNRAMAEARGEFVLWMADDDLLVDGLLSRYDAVLRAEPHVDVIYGKLQIFDGESGRDLEVFTPNDWTGREAALLGAKLHGSCVPDGGTATRRALYRQVGRPIYDPEFTRAQDYELWTRLVGHGRFRFVDEVVYRYRKHAGGTSWGPFVDLSYDSKIIRRHFARHAIGVLFPGLAGESAARARRAAWAQVGRLMLAYHDPHNAERFLAAAGPGFEPAWVEAWVQARVMGGDLAGAAAVVDRFAAGWGAVGLGGDGGFDPAAGMRARVEAAVALRAAGEAALVAGRASEAERRAVEFFNRFGLTADVARLRGRARVAGGDAREGLWFLCQAARLAVEDAALADEVAGLATALGVSGPRVDVAGMRRRLCEVFTELEVDEAGDEAITAIVVADGRPGEDAAAAVASAWAQSRAPAEVLVVGAVVEGARAVGADGDAGAIARRRAALAAVRTPLVAWLTADCRWLPDHLARLGAVIGEGAAAVADGLRCAEGAVTLRAVDPALRASADAVPLSALLHRRGAAADFDGGDWGFVLDLGRAGEPARAAGASWVGDPAVAVAGGEALEALCARAGRTAGEARRRQVEALWAEGFDWPVSGGAAVVLVGGDDAGAFARSLDGLAATRCPRAVVVVADAPGAGTRAALAARAEAEGFVVLATRVACGAKAVNLGLARAMGDGVAVLRAGARVAPGWLGRLRFAGRSAAVVRAGGLVHGWPACVWVARRALDAVGGLDAVLGDRAAVADWLARLAAAGFAAVAVDGVGVEGDGAGAVDAAVGGASVGDAAVGDAVVGDGPWIEPTPPVATRPLWRPIGAEEGFRPDAPPVVVVEAAARNVLVMPPWADAAAIAALAARLRALPDGVAVWLRASPGAGAAAMAALGEVDGGVLVVDAALAPDREGGLFAAADAVYVEPGWPDAARTVRRAVDAGRPVLRGAAALGAWFDETGGAR